MNLAVYITGHGYGHLTRTLEIARLLKLERPEVMLHVRAPFTEEQVREALTFPADSFSNVRLDVGLVQKDSLRCDFAATLDALRYYFGPEGDKLVQAEAGWLEENAIDAALLDIPPRAFDACRIAGVPAFGMTNFSWDWIWRDLAGEHPAFAGFADRAAASYRTCEKLFRTVMHAGLDAFPVVEDVPLVARISNLEPSTVREKLGISADRPVVVLSFGGEGLKGVTFPEKKLHDRFSFVVTEPMADPGPPFMFISDRMLREHGLRYCDLVHAADIIMTKPGYSTVAECTANRTAIVYTDRGRFAEYPYVEAFLRSHLPAEYLPAEKLTMGEWANALQRLAEAMPFNFPPVRADGAEVVASRLLGELMSRRKAR